MTLPWVTVCGSQKRHGLNLWQGCFVPYWQTCLGHLGFFNSAINPPTSSSPNKRISFVKKSIQKMNGNRIPNGPRPLSVNSLLRAYIDYSRFFCSGGSVSGNGPGSWRDFLENKKKTVTSNISVSWLRRGAPNSPASKALPNRDLSGFFSPRVEATSASKILCQSIILEVFI